MKKIFTLAFMAITAIIISACSEEKFEDAYYTTYTFYSENPEENQYASKTERRYKIGDQYYSSDLPKEDDSAFSYIKTGYSIDGWKYIIGTSDENESMPSTISTNSDGTVSHFTVTPRKESFYISSWSAVTYTIRFDSNGGDGYMPDLYMTYDEASSLSENTFTFYGHTFAGWNTQPDGSGRFFSDKQEVLNLASNKNETVTLYAQWDSNSYTVIFHSNYADDDLDVCTVVWGESIILSQHFSRPGYRMTGYNTESSGSGTSYAIGDSFEPIEEGINLYAQWEIETYTLEFDAAGGTGAPDSRTFHYGDTIEIQTSKPTKSGFKFMGWSGSDGMTYSPGSTFTGTGSVTLTAMWKPRGNTKIVHDFNATVSISYTDTGMTITSTIAGRWECDETTIASNTTTISISYADYSTGDEHSIAFTGVHDETFAFAGITFTIDEED